MHTLVKNSTLYTHSSRGVNSGFGDQIVCKWQKWQKQIKLDTFWGVLGYWTIVFTLHVNWCTHPCIHNINVKSTNAAPAGNKQTFCVPGTVQKGTYVCYIADVPWSPSKVDCWTARVRIIYAYNMPVGMTFIILLYQFCAYLSALASLNILNKVLKKY